MRRLSRRIVLPVFGLAMAALGLALSAPAPATPAVHPVFRHRLRECLSILDLSDAQKASIQAILDAAARPTLAAALDANPPDVCAIGTDALALKSAREALRAERESVRQQVEATL